MEEKENKEIPAGHVPIAQVYEWGQKHRRYGSRITSRAIQWYVTNGLVPHSTHFGKQAYYQFELITSYLRAIEILNNRFGYLLSQIKTIFRKAESLGTLEIPQNVDWLAPYEGNGVEALCRFLQDFIQYEELEEAKCDVGIDGPMLSADQGERISDIAVYIKKKIDGSKEGLKKMIEKGVLELEAELFAK